jgi:hypothetical protein
MYIKSHRKKEGLLGLILRSGRELRPKLIALSSCPLFRHRCKILFFVIKERYSRIYGGFQIHKKILLTFYMVVYYCDSY